MEAPGSFVDHILYVPTYSSYFNHEELDYFGTFINLVCRPVTNQNLSRIDFPEEVKKDVYLWVVPQDLHVSHPSIGSLESLLHWSLAVILEIKVPYFVFSLANLNFIKLRMEVLFSLNFGNYLGCGNYFEAPFNRSQLFYIMDRDLTYSSYHQFVRGPCFPHSVGFLLPFDAPAAH